MSSPPPSIDDATDPCPRCGVGIPAAATACPGCRFSVTPRRPAERPRRLSRITVGAIIISTLEMAVLLWLIWGRAR